MLAAFQQNSNRIKGLVHPAPPLKDMVLAKIHEELQNDISAYLDNELVPERHACVEAHLATCNECSDMLTAFQQNRVRIKGFEHRSPLSIQTTVMAQIREQAAKTTVEEPSRTRRLPDFGRWIPDFGRWFLRPVTAGATGLLTLVLVLGTLYFYPTGSQYEETLDYYFGIHTEQFTDTPFEDNLSSVQQEDALESDGDASLFLDLYLENVGN